MNYIIVDTKKLEKLKLAKSLADIKRIYPDVEIREKTIDDFYMWSLFLKDSIRIDEYGDFKCEKDKGEKFEFFDKGLKEKHSYFDPFVFRGEEAKNIILSSIKFLEKINKEYLHDMLAKSEKLSNFVLGVEKINAEKLNEYAIEIYWYFYDEFYQGRSHLNLSDQKSFVTDSMLFRHRIYNLIHALKYFDPEKHVLVVW